MAHTIKVSDGTQTIDFLGSNYKILADGGWGPRRAQRRRSKMGGRSPYQDVTETMAISISGTSEADVMSKYAGLSDLLDQVEAWASGEIVTAVYIEYEPDGSEVGSVKSVLTGPPEMGEFITPPRNFSFIYRDGRYVIGTNQDPIILSFNRRGLWLGETETKNVPPFIITNPTIKTVGPFTDDAPLLWPYDALIDLSAAPVGAGEIYLCFSSENDAQFVKEGEDNTATTGAAWSDELVAAASGGIVKQYDPGATTEATVTYTLSIKDYPLSQTVKNYALFVTLMNPGDNASYTIRPYLSRASRSSQVADIEWRKKVVDTTISDPQIVGFGSVRISDATTPDDYFLVLGVTADTTGDATDKIQIDSIMLVGTNEASSIVRLTSNIDQPHTRVEHRQGSRLSPRVYTSTGGDSEIGDEPYEGNIALFGSGSYVQCTIFGTDKAGNWLIEDVSNNKLAVGMSVTRTRAYLTPPAQRTGNLAANESINLTESVSLSITGP